ncbi:hypothetical protein LOTGIDRAFT_164133 [Lottia gigantea]|uniref:PiggyBac transposable element-derived protein domain-containing protein n=1 Tax=Lottia gigantea TaxID=225164 RepID=V4A6B2_LOTGI|nr:hypothetical protein LOTGIDRAFT_164133 [Lottia gigantea]ESO90545.1 hypothetical protein LOTGIDRAFT_164133 [Lottia gigantea]
MAEATCSQKPSREDTCQRWSKKDGKYITVSRPAIVKSYNDKMGGVDLHDWMISFYRLAAKSQQLLAASREDETSSDDSDYEPVVKRVALPIDYYRKADAKHLPQAYPGCTRKTRVRTILS